MIVRRRGGTRYVKTSSTSGMLARTAISASSSGDIPRSVARLCGGDKVQKGGGCGAGFCRPAIIGERRRLGAQASHRPLMRRTSERASGSAVDRTSPVRGETIRGRTAARAPGGRHVKYLPLGLSKYTSACGGESNIRAGGVAEIVQVSLDAISREMV